MAIESVCHIRCSLFVITSLLTYGHQNESNINLSRPSDAKSALIARFMGPPWGTSGADRTQVGPMLAPWTLLSGCASESCPSLIQIIICCLFVWHQVIVWANADVLLFGPLGTNFNEISMKNTCSLQENFFYNIVRKITAYLSQPYCVNGLNSVDWFASWTNNNILLFYKFHISFVEVLLSDMWTEICSGGGGY